MAKESPCYQKRLHLQCDLLRQVGSLFGIVTLVRDETEAEAQQADRKHPVSTAVTPAAGVLLRAYATNA